MAHVPGGVLGLLTILAGFFSPALFIILVRRVIAGLRTGEIWFRGKLDRRAESALGYWTTMLVTCIGTVASGAIMLIFFSLSLVLIKQRIAG